MLGTLVRSGRQRCWPRYEPAGRAAMIFAEDGPRLEKDPFAPSREMWSGLEWQPGTWWNLEDAS